MTLLQGVIIIIGCIEAGIKYTNKEARFKTAHAEIVSIDWLKDSRLS